MFSWRHRHGHSLKETETRRSDRKTFQTEHITQDIVCKLSVHEMEMLGINSRSDMMFLQIEFTLIVASRVIRARWREFKDLCWNSSNFDTVELQKMYGKIKVF